MSHPTGETVQSLQDLVTPELFARIGGCADAAKSLLDEMDEILEILRVVKGGKGAAFAAAVLTICGTDVAHAWAHLATLAGRDPNFDYREASRSQVPDA